MTGSRQQMFRLEGKPMGLSFTGRVDVPAAGLLAALYVSESGREYIHLESVDSASWWRLEAYAESLPR